MPSIWQDLTHIKNYAQDLHGTCMERANCLQKWREPLVHDGDVQARRKGTAHFRRK